MNPQKHPKRSFNKIKTRDDNWKMKLMKLVFLKTFFISFMIAGGDDMPSKGNLTKLADSSFVLETIRILNKLRDGSLNEYRMTSVRNVSFLKK